MTSKENAKTTKKELRSNKWTFHLYKENCP